MIFRFYKLMDKLICPPYSEKQLTMDLEEAAMYSATPAIQEMNIEFSSLDAKASALISHLSLMVAAISVLHSSVSVGWLKAIFIAEIIFYVITLILVIRVIFYMYYSEIIERHSEPTPDERSAEYMKELNNRMFYYRLAHFMTNIGTVFLVVSLVLTFFVP